MSLIYKVREHSSQDGKEFILSDFTRDRYGDSIVAAGWDLRNFSKNPIALFGHRSDFIVGRWLQLRVDGGALIGRLQLAPAGTSDRIDEVRKLVDAEILCAVSVGFRPIESHPRSDGPGEIYTKQELVEVSLCAVPANPNALAIAKSLGVSRTIIGQAFTNNYPPVTITEHRNKYSSQQRHDIYWRGIETLVRTDKLIKSWGKR